MLRAEQLKAVKYVITVFHIAKLDLLDMWLTKR